MRARVVSSMLLGLGFVAPSIQAAAPVHVWSQRYGDLSGAQIGHGIVMDAAGNTVVTGQMLGTVDFGGGPLVTGTTIPDVFVAKFGPTGSHLWSKRFGDGTQQVGTSVALDGQGNVIVTGYFNGTVNFGGGNLTNLGNNDIFLVKLDSDGNHVWSRQYGNSAVQQGLSVAVDASGNIVLTGRLTGSADFGGGVVTGAGLADAFVAKLDPNGSHLWSRAFGDGSNQWGRSIAVDGSGNVVLTGEFRGDIDFGGGALTSAGSDDVYVAKLDANGNHVWSQRYGDASAQTSRGIDADAAGNIAVTGQFQGSIDFGGGPLASTGDEDGFVVQLGPGGVHAWSRRFGNTPDVQAGNAVVFDAAGNLLLTGTFSGSVDFGGGAFTPGGIYVAKWNATGTHLWSQQFGTTGGHECWAIAANSSGRVAITGALNGSADFGGGLLTSTNGADDVFVAVFGDDGMVPVLFSAFTTAATADGVEIAWDLWSDEGLDHFVLQRRTGNAPAVTIASGDARTTRVVDRDVRPGATYAYELLVFTAAGDVYRSPVSSVSVAPVATALRQNYPNPFNPRTTIEYTVGTTSAVSIDVASVSGALVARLDQGVRQPGTHRVEWDGRDADGRPLPSGEYFYRLSGTRSEPRRMVLLK